MIKTKSDLKEFIRTEEARYFTPPGAKRRRRGNCLQWKWQKNYRKLEYHLNNKGFFHKLASKFYKLLSRRYALKLGFEIPPNVFDKGLKIIHSGAVVINGGSRVGENCTIIGSTCLGGKNGSGGPTIGNDCELGMFCCVIGDIRIGNSVKIGAGAVVVKECLEDDVSLAGVPAKIVKRKE